MSKQRRITVQTAAQPAYFANVDVACKQKRMMSTNVFRQLFTGIPLADLGFFRGGDFGNQSERALRGSGLTGE